MGWEGREGSVYGQTGHGEVVAVRRTGGSLAAAFHGVAAPTRTLTPTTNPQNPYLLGAPAPSPWPPTPAPSSPVCPTHRHVVPGCELLDLGVGDLELLGAVAVLADEAVDERDVVLVGAAVAVGLQVAGVRERSPGRAS